MSGDPARDDAVAIAKTLRDNGYDALLCGGCVRDHLMGRVPNDYDIATSARPEETAALFPHAVTVGAQFGVVIVPRASGKIEVATFRSDQAYVDGRRPEGVVFSDPPTDAQRRDFTVNALFEDPETGEIHDHVNGLPDLRSRLLRAIGDAEARFREDHLRILRAVRLSVQLDFAIEPQTMEAVRALAPLVAKVSAERVRDELVKLLRFGRGRGLRLLRDAGLLPVILPEIDAMRGVEQPHQWHPEGDVFVHTCLVLDGVPPLDADAETDVLLSALLHDVAKPTTQTFDPDGRVRFNSHDRLGREMSRELLERLRFPKRTIERVEELVGSHMKFGAVEQMRPNKLRRFLGQDDVELHLALHEADCGASHGNLSALAFCRDKLKAYGEEPVIPPPLLTGTDLLAMGYPEGRRIGEILRRVQDLQLDGELATREEAARCVRREFPQPPAGVLSWHSNVSSGIRTVVDG